MPPLVSVILPTYNRERFLREALDSVLEQTHAELEALVVDDGSTDGTRELVLERSRADERVRYHRQANAGVAAARNTGMRLARGELIAFIDSDDVWKPWKLELQLRCLEMAPEAGMLWTDMEAIGPDGAEIAPSYLTQYYRAYRYITRDDLFSQATLLDGRPGSPPEWADRKLYVGDIFSEMVMGNLVHTPTVILRRERLAQVGSFDESFRQGGEDYDYYLRTCRAGPVAYADVSSIRYRVGMSDNLSNPSNDVHYATSYLAVLEPVLDQDRDRIELPPAMITEARAHGYRWLARALLLSGQAQRARPYLRRALRLRPWQPEALILVPLAYAPSGTGARLARALRWAKRRWANATRDLTGVGVLLADPRAEWLLVSPVM